RDTGTWAAVGDPQDTPEPGGPFPRARGGWRARDTGGWQAPDTGSWDPREVERAAARERAAAAGWHGQSSSLDVPNGPNGRNGQAAGGWNDRASDRWGAPAMGGSQGNLGWGSQRYDASRGTDNWNSQDVADAIGTGDWNAHDVTDPGFTTGAWSSQDVTATNPGQWDEQDTMSWNPVTAGEWEHDEPGWNGQGRHSPGAHSFGATMPPGPNGTAGPPAAGPPAAASSDPLSADWEPDEVARSAYPPPQTQDAAAVWHGSPFPEDTGGWSLPAAVPAAAAITGAPAPSIAAAPSAASPAEAPARAGGGSRYVGRRSARKPRVTTQAIFAQLLDLASIPQSSYAVDTEVDGAMCLVRARGGYEVFSAADQSRHEVRFFEDEEAAYFYLFGVLAADAIRNGQLGPRT
ncbi:MAG TPA: hypothetical protein VG268_23125, partial [Streptosporangiaceae bacterium]|nr:hypothetical protein [Streptosporangiaceae bacterium]